MPNQAFFGHFEKNSSPKKLKAEKTQGNFLKNSSLFLKNSRFCQLILIIFETKKSYY